MTTPAYQIRLHDLRQLVGGLVDLRARGALQDLRQLVGGLVEIGVPEVGVGGVLTVAGRVPALTTTGTPNLGSPAALPWEVGGSVNPSPLSASSVAIEEPETIRYVPGPTRPGVGQQLVDRFHLTADGLDTFGTIVWTDGDVPTPSATTVAIGEDRVWAPSAGETVTLTASGGTGPYTWALVENRTGGSITAGGVYTAGVTGFGVDRVVLTDAADQKGYLSLEVKPWDLSTSGFPGVYYLPWARLTLPPENTNPVIEWVENGTGATFLPATPRRLRLEVLDQDGLAVDLSGWAFSARLLSQRGSVLAAGLEVSASGSTAYVTLPDPDTLLFTPAVLRLEAETAGILAASGYPVVAFEVLLLGDLET